jgi:hypothetical protein
VRTNILGNGLGSRRTGVWGFYFRERRAGQKSLLLYMFFQAFKLFRSRFWRTFLALPQTRSGRADRGRPDSALLLTLLGQRLGQGKGAR